MADRRLQRPQTMQQTTPTVPSFHEPSSLSTAAFLPTGCPESSNSSVINQSWGIEMERMVSGRPSRLLYRVSVNPPLDTTIPLSFRLQATLPSHCFYQA
eukprot:scaffold64057_cov38-Cyclotella_meneghiniana.AAC.2